MDYNYLVKMAMLAGEIMLTSGAETYRIEDTMGRILRVSKLTSVETLVSGTGIYVSLSPEDILDGNKDNRTITAVKRIDKRVTDLGKVYRVNNVSRKFCSEEITLREAYEELHVIKNTRMYNDLYKFVGNIGTVIFFTVLLGGSKYDFLISSMNGILLAVVLYLLNQIKLNQFMTNVMGAFTIAVSSIVFLEYVKIPIQLDMVISGSILPLVPGVAITNAIRDTLNGDYVSGGARAIEAFIMAASIAVGIGVGLALLTK